jgi:hypothetical protein
MNACYGTQLRVINNDNEMERVVNAKDSEMKNVKLYRFGPWCAAKDTYYILEILELFLNIEISKI